MRPSRWLMVALFVVSAVLVVEAQQPGRVPGFGGVNTTNAVVTNKDLQEELKITDAQKEKLKGASEKLAELAKKRTDAFKGGGKGGFDKEKAAEMQKESEAVNAEVKKSVDEVLTADQKKRLAQIDVQAKGLRAFSDEKIAKELNITESQTSKIKGVMDDYAKDTKDLGFGGGGKGGFDKEKAVESLKKREKLTKAATADIEEMLTADQKAKWKEMVGAPFDTAKLRQGFGGGGFGGNKNKTKD